MNQMRSRLTIQGAIAFFSGESLQDLLPDQAVIEQQAAAGQIVALAIIWRGPEATVGLDPVQRNAFYQWLNQLNLLTVAVMDQRCQGEVMELLFRCDIRLGGNQLAVQFPSPAEQLSFDFKERCQLLMGKNGSGSLACQLFDQTWDANRLLTHRLVNQILPLDGPEGIHAVRLYLEKLLSGKEPFQIQAILMCFKHYQKLGLNTDREALLAEEARRFCELVMRNQFSTEGDP